jgi:P4 family phage/plasmid primase-like protien
MSEHEERVAAALQSLQFRYKGVPEDAQITVATWEEGRFGFKQFRANQLDIIAGRYAGDESVEVWTRTSVLGSAFASTDKETGRSIRGGEKDTWGTTNVHVDIDPRPKEELGETVEGWRERMLREFEHLPIQPSGIESSGRGFHLYWKIGWTEGEEGLQKVKQANKWWSAYFGDSGDKCFDLSRVLRLPGTFNPKQDGGWATIVYHTDVVYDLSQFELASLTSDELNPEEIVEEVLPIDFAQQLRTSNGKLWDRIYTEETAFAAGAPHNNGRVIRHRNDYFIALQLMRYGYTPGQVASVLMHPTWFSGQKWREEGRHESYIAVTIGRAKQDVAAPELTTEPELVAYLRDKHDLMYYGKQWYEWDNDRGVYVPDQYLLSRHVQRYAALKCKPSLITGTESMLRPWCDVSGSLPTDSTHLINTPDGMLEWQTGKMFPHNQGWKSMFQIEAKWDPRVDCREVDEYLASLFEPDAVLAWWEFAGYSLMVEHTQHKWRSCLAIIGPARTGKSTLLGALEEFVGRQYVSHLSLAELTGEGNNFTTSFLVGKLLNIDPDAPYEKGMRNQHLIKQLASGDPVGIERKGDPDHMSANLPVKLAFGMNDLPIAAMADQAFYDRWIPLYIRTDRRAKPFTQDSKETKLNRHLTLLSSAKNRSAWLKRSVEGLCSMAENNGHKQSEMIRKNRTDFQSKSDPVFAFLQQGCTSQDDKWLGVKDFYGPYTVWCQENGYNPVATRVLSSRMKDIANGAFSGSETLGLRFRNTDRLEFRGLGPKAMVVRIKGSAEVSVN